MKLPFFLLSTAGIVLSSASFCARAASTPVVESNPAVAVCQAARSANEGSLRKRPKAVQNEGTTGVFVTCGLHGNGHTSIEDNSKTVVIYLLNIGAAPVTVSCTAVDASIGDITTTRSSTMAPNSVGQIVFVATDVDEQGRWATPAFSCSLPPGAGIRQLWHRFDQEIGE